MLSGSPIAAQYGWRVETLPSAPASARASLSLGTLSGMLYLWPQLNAQVVELVDTLDSGSSGGNTVEVRVLSWAIA